MKVFIINLEKHTARKEHTINQCLQIGLTPEIFPAVDGRLLSPQEMARSIHPELSVGLTASEIGCALSHHAVYQKMVNENISYALILEDDVLFDSYAHEVVEYLEAHIPKKPTLYLLSDVEKYMRSSTKIPNSHHKIVNVSQAALAHAYIINLAAAKKLQKFMFPVWLEADRWTFIKESGIVGIKAVVPSVGHLSELSYSSTIWDSEAELERKKIVRELRKETICKIRKSRPFKTKLKNALWRIFIRTFFETKRA